MTPDVVENKTFHATIFGIGILNVFYKKMQSKHTSLLQHIKNAQHL
jgi:hypothetical protein